ncbi:MAG: glycosyltransferase family 4 protein [Acidobacteriia bacterium]|nr:glycosyltransferase family 4 protein [Terriglobia bacterium]
MTLAAGAQGPVAAHRDVLVLMTGAFRLGGGIAASNRLVLKALSDPAQGAARLTVLAFNEPIGSRADGAYLDLSRSDWRAFGRRYAAFIAAAWRQALGRQWDLILVDHVGIACALAPLARLGLCSYVLMCYRGELTPSDLSPRRRVALFAATRRIATSDATAAYIRERFPTLDAAVSELAIDPETALATPPQTTTLVLANVAGEQHPIGPRMVLCVGRMERTQRHKGQDVLIRATPAILRRFPDAQIVLAGGGDWYDELAQVARAEGVSRSVFLTGFVATDLRDELYGRCAVFAMPSHGEGFGLVHLEAMRWSKPCIGGALDSARDLIVDGETGVLLADPRDSALVAKAIVDLLSDPQLAAAFGAGGRRRLEERYLFPHFQARFYRALGWA